MRVSDARRDSGPSLSPGQLGRRSTTTNNSIVWRNSVIVAVVFFCVVLLYRYNFDTSINVIRTAQTGHPGQLSEPTQTSLIETKTNAQRHVSTTAAQRLSDLPKQASSKELSNAPNITIDNTTVTPQTQPAPPLLPFRYPRVIVSLTTIPDRIWYLNDTLVSITQQSRVPDEIVLAIPYTSRRFRNETDRRQQMKYVIPDFISQFNVTVLRCHDSGPGTKFVPIIHREMAEGRWDSIVVIADDDVIYPKDWLETYLRAYEDPKLHGSALGMRGYCVLPYQSWDWPVVSQAVLHGGSLNVTTQVDVLTANHGILVRPYLFRKYNITIPEDAPDSAFYMDDIWINGVLARNGVTKYVVPIAKDPKHRPNVQKKTVSLERVPNGRPFHNSYLMRYFGKYWSYCPQTRAKDLPPEVYKPPFPGFADRTAYDDDEEVKLIRQQERAKAEKEIKLKIEREKAREEKERKRRERRAQQEAEGPKETLFERYRRLQREEEEKDKQKATKVSTESPKRSQTEEEKVSEKTIKKREATQERADPFDSPSEKESMSLESELAALLKAEQASRTETPKTVIGTKTDSKTPLPKKKSVKVSAIDTEMKIGRREKQGKKGDVGVSQEKGSPSDIVEARMKESVEAQAEVDRIQAQIDALTSSAAALSDPTLSMGGNEHSLSGDIADALAKDVLEINDNAPTDILSSKTAHKNLAGA